MNEKTIIYEPGKPPRFTGVWTFEDFYILIRWLMGMPLTQEQPQEQVNDGE